MSGANPPQIPRDFESCQNRKYFPDLMLKGGNTHNLSLIFSLCLSIVIKCTYTNKPHVYPQYPVCLWKDLLRKKLPPAQVNTPDVDPMHPAYMQIIMLVCPGCVHFHGALT